MTSCILGELRFSRIWKVTGPQKEDFVAGYILEMTALFETD